MNNFKGGFKKGSSAFNGKKKYGDSKHQGSNRPAENTTQLFSATCSECYKKCDVPFRPSADKPVYCSACFGMKKSANESRGSESKHSRGDKGSHHSSERPSHQPVHGHTQHTNSHHADLHELKQQMKGLEVKLNKILELINPPLPSPKVAQREAVSSAPKAPTKKVAAKKVAKATTKKGAKKVTAKKVTKKAAAKKPAK